MRCWEKDRLIFLSGKTFLVDEKPWPWKIKPTETGRQRRSDGDFSIVLIICFFFFSWQDNRLNIHLLLILPLERWKGRLPLLWVYPYGLAVSWKSDLREKEEFASKLTCVFESPHASLGSRSVAAPSVSSWGGRNSVSFTSRVDGFFWDEHQTDADGQGEEWEIAPSRGYLWARMRRHYKIEIVFRIFQKRETRKAAGATFHLSLSLTTLPGWRRKHRVSRG